MVPGKFGVGGVGDEVAKQRRRYTESSDNGVLSRVFPVVSARAGSAEQRSSLSGGRAGSVPRSGQVEQFEVGRL